MTSQRYNDVHGRMIFLILTSLFVAALVSCNLIANKFVSVDLGFRTFQVSAGVIPYPLTFLITDVLSEIYGRRKTNAVVLSGFFASMLVLLILYAGNVFPAIDVSPVSDEEYSTVFSNSWRIIGASMVAYLAAQFLDVKIFHSIKKATHGKHLWLRNNFSTVLSQLVDTILVTSVIFVGIADIEFIKDLVWDGWLFKVIFAAADTVLIYLIVFYIRRRFKLSRNQEMNI